jgi:hypothetical protein
VCAAAQSYGRLHASKRDQLAHAVTLLRGVDLPFERAEVELRAGVALAAAGERETALERLCGAYRTARKLGAPPLATQAAREVAALGEPVVRRLGRRAAADADGAGLSRREVELVRLVALGRKNRESPPSSFSAPARSTCMCATSCASSTAAPAWRRHSARELQLLA